MKYRSHRNQIGKCIPKASSSSHLCFYFSHALLSSLSWLASYTHSASLPHNLNSFAHAPALTHHGSLPVALCPQFLATSLCLFNSYCGRQNNLIGTAGLFKPYHTDQIKLLVLSPVAGQKAGPLDTDSGFLEAAGDGCTLNI